MLREGDRSVPGAYREPRRTPDGRRLQNGALMRRDRFQGRPIGGIHREDGVVDAGERGRLLSGLLDARFVAEVHPLVAALFDGADLILKTG